MKEQKHAPEALNAITIERVHAVWIGVLSVLGPFATAFWFVAGIKAEMQTYRLESEKLYVKKDDLKGFTDKLDKISENQAELRGFLSAKDQKK